MRPARGWVASMVLACCAGSAMAQLAPNDRLGDLLDHPALAGYAQLLLPRSETEVDRKTRLSDFASLLPYHTQVHAGDVVAGLNRLIDDAGAGRRVFIDIYSPAEKARDPTKADTGLFFLRGRPGAAFAVIAPGGGFSYVATVHEGLPYALAINRHGFNAFVLRYRVGQGGTAATEDLAAALSTIFRQAQALQVRTEGYSLWGSSAGARMAAAIGSPGAARFGAEQIPRPAAVVMAYTGHTDTSGNLEEEPSTFVVVGEHDPISPPAVMERRLAALERAGVRVAYRKVPGLGHGFGLGNGTAAQGWIDDAVRFWESAASRGPGMPLRPMDEKSLVGPASAAERKR